MVKSNEAVGQYPHPRGTSTLRVQTRAIRLACPKCPVILASHLPLFPAPRGAMPNLNVTEIKAFVPARDFTRSKQFYQDLGFTLASDGDGVSLFSSRQRKLPAAGWQPRGWPSSS